MHAYGPSCGGIMLLVITQLLGPASLWAAESQRAAKGDSPRRAVVSGLRGEVLVSPADTTREPQPLRFHDGVSSGDQLTTGAGGVLEVLVGRHALVTLDENSSLQFLDESPGHTVLQLTRGEVRLAVARAEDTLTVHTPTATTVTHGGLIRINMIVGKRQALRQRGDWEAHAMPVVFTPIPSGGGARTAGPGRNHSSHGGNGSAEVIHAGSIAGQCRSRAECTGSGRAGGQALSHPVGAGGQVCPPGCGTTRPYSGRGNAKPRGRSSVHRRRPCNVSCSVRPISKVLSRKMRPPSAFLSTDGVIISTTGAGLTLSQEQPTRPRCSRRALSSARRRLTPRKRSGTGIADDTTTVQQDLYN